MRGRRGRHRARRPRLETLARAAVALTLCAPLATIAPTPAAAGTTLAVDLLGDLAPDPNIPDSYLLEGPVASGDRTFFSAAAAESAAIFSTSGAPGDAVEMTFPPTPACTDAPAPYDLVAVGDGSVVFQSQAGCNNGQQRLVITDGSNDPGTTCPVQPQGTCDFAEYTGYYGISPRVYYQGQYAGEGPSTLSPTTSEGVVFAAAAVDTNSDSNPVYGDYLPYQLTRDGNGDAVVTPLDAGFPYQGPGGAPFEYTPASMVGGFLTTVGDKVFAELLDCDPAAATGPTACDGSENGAELYVLDLTAATRSWTLIDGGLSTGPASTSFTNPAFAGLTSEIGVAGGWLFFLATPSGGDLGLYATDGTTIESVALPIPEGLAPADLAYIAEYPTRGTVGDFLFFPWEDAANSRALWRVSGDTAATPEIVSTDCGDDGGDAATVGTTLYIACNAVLDSGNPDLPWETGSELFALTGAGDADLSGRTPQIVFDFNYAGGPATYPDDSGQSLSPGYLTVVGDTLFMTGWDFADNASGQALYALAPGDPAPAVAVRFNELYTEYVEQIAAAGGKLFAWADDGIHGIEPWVGTLSDAQQVLTVSVSGSGTVSSDPAGLSCTATCEALFDGASTVTLDALAAPGWSFGGWVGCEAVPGVPTSCTVRMGGPRSVAALFTASPTYRLLEDLNPDGDSGSIGQCADTYIRSGGSYYFSVQVGDGQGCVLLASTGAPGGGTLIDLQPSNPESGGDPVPLAALDGGRVLLAGSDGDELGGEPRLFVSDGTLIGTHPLQPADLCGATPAPSCGFYAEGFGGQGWTFASRLVTTTASEGVVFAARAFSGSGDQPEPPVPWRTFDGSGVEDLTRGFSYDPAAALLSAYGGMTGFMLTAVGDVVYADLADCYDAGCDDGNEGRELYALDVAAEGSTWQLIAGLSANEGATWDFTAFDTAGGRLVFGATPLGGNPGLYWTDGDGATLITDAYFCFYCNYFHPGRTVGDSYFFYGWDQYGSPSFLRYRFATGSTIAVSGCSDGWGTYTGVEPPVVAMGTSVYFACGDVTFDSIYRYTLGGGRAKLVYAQYSQVDPPISPLAPRDMSVYGGSLYFIGADPLDGTSELFRYTGGGDPTIVPFGSVPANAEGLRVIGDRFFVWADDGVHGLEPWVGRLAGNTLTVALSGSGSVMSSPAGIDCVGPDTCSAEYDKGTLVTLTASPGEGFDFKGWSSNCAVGDDPLVCTVSMSKARTVGAFFAALGDQVALVGSAPSFVGSGGLVPYSLVVSNFSAGDLSGLNVGVQTSLVVQTAGCTSSTGTYSYVCALPTIPAGGTRSVVVYAVAPASGTAAASFTVTPPPIGDDETNNSVALAVEVRTDVLSLSLASVPVTATEGTPVTYGLALRNGTSGGAATLATGIVLRASFDEAGLTFPAATGCAQDATPPVGYGTSITCSLADLAADTVRTLVFTVYAPATASGLDLEATFAVTYAESAGTITANDADGPTIASITPLPTAGAVTVEQSFDVPTTTTTDVTTVPVTGLSADDQTGSVVSLPGGFLGSLDSSEVLEPRTAAVKGTVGATRVTDAGVFRCTTAARNAYDAACWVFDLTIEQSIVARQVFTFTFRYDASAFANLTTGKLLAIRYVVLYHDDGSGFAPVAACPRKATAANYAGSTPCLLRKSVERATGDYVFVVLSPENGQWKGGR